MRSRFLFLTSILAGTQLCSAATLVGLYDFNNTLNPAAGTAGPLTAVDPGSVSGFQADVVNGQNRTVYRFNGSASPATSQGGLQFTDADLMNANNYTIELYFSFDAVTGWRRILDTKDRTLDQGFYVLNGGLQLYPSGVGLGTFSANTYYHVVLTFDGTTAIAYLDGVAQSTQATNYYSLPASDLISLFLDNTADIAQTEYSPGKIAWAKFYDGALTAREVSTAYQDAIDFRLPTSEIPEPSTLALLAGGAAVAAARRRLSRH